MPRYRRGYTKAAGDKPAALTMLDDAMALRDEMLREAPRGNGAAPPSAAPSRNPMLMTVDEFCRNNRISISHYYILKKKGEAPREIRSGKRVMISHEAESDWRRALEK